MSSLWAPRLENRRALVTAVEQEIESGEIWNELAVQLSIGRVREVLPLHGHPVLREQIDVQIVLRGVATEITLDAEVAAQIHQALRLLAGDPEFGRSVDRRRQRQPPRHQIDDRDVEG